MLHGRDSTTVLKAKALLVHQRPCRAYRRGTGRYCSTCARSGKRHLGRAAAVDNQAPPPRNVEVPVDKRLKPFHTTPAANAHTAADDGPTLWGD